MKILKAVKNKLAWDRDISLDELIQAVRKGHSPFFERALIKFGWFELLQIFGSAEKFFKVLSEKKDFADQREIFKNRLNDYLELKKIFYEIHKQRTF